MIPLEYGSSRSLHEYLQPSQQNLSFCFGDIGAQKLVGTPFS
jgi:hypothetical protein